jgi:cell division initiation protein
MKISPMDIQRQVFSNRMRGFDRDEVRTYLTLVAEELAGLQRERDAFEQEVQSLRSIVEEHRQREQILKNTLLTAQKVSEEIREGARRQAEAVVREAEVQADRLVELAQSRAHEVERTIVDLRAQRASVRIDLRALLERVSTLLELQEEAESNSEGNLHFLVRRREQA